MLSRLFIYSAGHGHTLSFFLLSQIVLGDFIGVRERGDTHFVLVTYVTGASRPFLFLFIIL